MKKLFKQLGSILILLSVIFGAGYAANRASATLNFVETPTTTLYASISGSATSMRVTPYPKDLDGNKLTMTDFGSSPTATIDPKVRNYEEIVGFTGITDNGDGTATLTGLTRDLTSKSPYTTTGTGRSHAASAIVVFSNNPQMYARFAAPENTATITNAWTFSTLPTFTNAPTTGTDGVNKAYADALSIQGAATSTESNMGIVQLASPTQAGSGTASSTQGRPLVLGSRLATSTCQVAQNSVLVASSTTGRLAGSCFDQTYPYTFTNPITLNSTTTLNATTTLGVNAVLTGFSYGMFGDGSDNASTTAGSGSFTLTRDMYFTNYTVGTNEMVNTGGYKIFVTGTLTVNGIIANNGGNGSAGGNSSGTAGTAGTAGAQASCVTLGCGIAGGAGGSGNGIGGGSNSNAIVLGGIGGNGGNGGAGTSHAGGSAGSVSTSTPNNRMKSPYDFYFLLNPTTTGTQFISGGVGGAGGGSGGNASAGASASTGGGGGGGGGGGIVALYARIITVGASGSIQANAGNGGGGGSCSSGDSAGAGGGGGGGGGGAVVLFYRTLTNSGAITETAGTLGSAGTASGCNAVGVAGTAGAAGQTYQFAI